MLGAFNIYVKQKEAVQSLSVAGKYPETAVFQLLLCVRDAKA